MSEQSLTPETDNAAYEDPTPGFAVVSYDFARNLERERDEARQDVFLASGELCVPMPEPGSDMARVMVANALMRRQRDEAREALESTQQELNKEIRQRQEKEKQLEAMRVAIKGAQIELAYAVGLNTASVMKNNISAALAKLQPFLKP